MSRELVCPAYALRVLHALEAAGYEAWVVGGWVRDALRGLPGHDVDVTTSAPWRETERVLRQAGITVHETGTKHGTVTAVVAGEPVEVTTYRVEGAYTDHRHPDEVRFVTDVREDLARRDFTINAMAWHPARGLLDPFGGERDLGLGVIRAVGEPRERFEEDALRVLRAVRFAARMGFVVEPHTQGALVACASSGELAAVAQERIGQELDGIVCTGRVSWALGAEGEVLCAAMPELAHMRGRWSHGGSAGQSEDDLGRCAHVCARVETLSGGRAARTLRWAALLHDVGTGDHADSARVSQRTLRRLAIPSEVTRPVGALIRSLRVLAAGPVPTATALGARRLLQAFSHDAPGCEGELALQALDLARAVAIVDGAGAERRAALDGLAAALRHELTAGPVFKTSQLAVSGADVMEACHLAPGPEVGRVLAALLEVVMHGEVPNEREAQLGWLRAQTAGKPRG